jgi:hypothetical protein
MSPVALTRAHRAERGDYARTARTQGAAVVAPPRRVCTSMYIRQYSQRDHRSANISDVHPATRNVHGDLI